MPKLFSIMHLSDLHRSAGDPISNDEIISALVSDRDRYTREDTRVSPPDAIVVSGDIVQGVGLGIIDHATELASQYEIAEQLFDELARRFLDGDRSRLVMVPGNHDVNWNVARDAMEIVPLDAAPSDIAKKLGSENSEYRWDWKSRTLFRIADKVKYASRLDAYWNFHTKFYSRVPNLLRVAAGAEANLFELCDRRIALVAFNSCHGNDCFAYHGMIRREVVARADLDLRDMGKPFDLRMAVWHHSIEGPPYKTDYMDVDIVRGMIGRGFRLGLYGHQHKVQITPQQIWLPDQERMAVISAGSLCAGAAELPTGTFRQYNILEIAPNFNSVRTHVRSMSVSNLFSRGSLREFAGASFADLDWKPALNPVGLAFDPKASRLRLAIEEAEIAAKTGKAADAVSILRNVDLPEGSYQRALLLSSAFESENWDLIAEVTSPPYSIDEFVQRVGALVQSNRFCEARKTLEDFSMTLNVPIATETALRQKIDAEETMRK